MKFIFNITKENGIHNEDKNKNFINTKNRRNSFFWNKGQIKGE